MLKRRNWWGEFGLQMYICLSDNDCTYINLILRIKKYDNIVR